MQCIVTYFTGTHFQLPTIISKIWFFNFTHLSFGNAVSTWAMMRGSMNIFRNQTGADSKKGWETLLQWLNLVTTAQWSWWVNIVLFTIHRCNKCSLTLCFSDRASWIDHVLLNNLMHWLLFIHKILFSSTCFEPQVLFFRRIQLYTCSIWYCHSLRKIVVACR